MTPVYVAVVALFAFSILVMYFVNQKTGMNYTPCLFKTMTQKPCFLCGGTRATVSLITGKITQAFLWNPLAVLLVVGFCALMTLHIVFGRVVTVVYSKRKWAWLIAILIVIANWVYLWINHEKLGI
ncbi:MAG: DUF2752 domain-containing protein [Verrucomicrobiota bacterium]